MALTIAELLALANELSGFSETDGAGFIKNVVHDLENDTVLLEAIEELTLVNGQRGYALSALTNKYRLPLHVQPKSGSEYYDELKEVSFDVYRARLKSNSGNSRPLVFSIFNEVVYLDPAPLVATYPKVDIWGPIEHGDDVTTIKYPEKFRALLSNGMAWEIFKSYGLVDEPKAQTVKADYETQKQQFTVRKANSKHHQVRYNDL